jgi:hypothetical protein
MPYVTEISLFSAAFIAAYVYGDRVKALFAKAMAQRGWRRPD